jgi:hypothetical protein
MPFLALQESFEVREWGKRVYDLVAVRRGSDGRARRRGGGRVEGRKEGCVFPCQNTRYEIQISMSAVIQTQPSQHVYAVLTNRIVLIRSDGDQGECGSHQPSAVIRR